MKAREWWILRAPGLPDYVYRDAKVAEENSTRGMDEQIHVREVRPGEITLTRDEFVHCLARLDCSFKSAVKLARELFPEGAPPAEGKTEIPDREGK